MQNINKIKQFFRDADWNERIRQMWLPIIFAVGFAVVLCLGAHDVLHASGYTAIRTFFGVGYLLFGMLQLTDFALVLGRNEGAWTAKSVAVHVLALVALLLDTIWRASSLEWGLTVKIGHSAVYAALFVCVFVVPTIRQKDDRQLVRFTAETLVIGTLLAISIGVATGALEGLLEGVTKLFGLSSSSLDKVSMDLLTVMMTGVLFSILVLVLPKPDKEGLATSFTQKLSNIFGKYILLPVLLLYMLVLYCYIIKILVTWQLPNGTVTWMTTVMMVALVLSVFTLYPVIYVEDAKKIWRITRCALPLMALPPLVLMSIGLARRVCDYGWTVDRIYTLIFHIWCYLACGLLLLASRKGGKILTRLIVSFFAIFLLISVIPGLNVAQCTRHLLTRQVSSLISKADVPFPSETAIDGYQLTEWLNKLADEQAEPIYSKLNYLETTFGNKSIDRWLVSEGNRTYYWSGLSHSKNSARGTLLEYGSYKDRSKAIELPAGYTHLKSLDEFSVTEQACGVFLLTSEEENISVTFVSKTIDPASSAFRLPLSDGRMLIFTYLHIWDVSYEDTKTLSVGASAYLLSK